MQRSPSLPARPIRDQQTCVCVAPARPELLTSIAKRNQYWRRLLGELFQDAEVHDPPSTPPWITRSAGRSPTGATRHGTTPGH